MKFIKKHKIDLIVIACVAIFCLALYFVLRDEKKGDNDTKVSGYYYCEIDIKNYGKVEVTLDANNAPITVANFIKLVEDHFYDGLTFHRMQKDFVLQGGDPSANGQGGSKDTIKGEFSSNGVNNTLKHTRGVLSMARSQSNDSASSQFFIVLSDTYQSSLNGKYASFGWVTSGMDIVDKVCKDCVVEDAMGNMLKANQPIINYIKMVDKPSTEE